MKTIKLIIYMTIFVIIAVVVGYYSSKYIVAWVTLKQVKGVAEAARRVKAELNRDKRYFDICHRKTGTRLFIPQLRFVNQSDYKTEVQCQDKDKTTVVMDSYSLLPIVKKLPPSSGMVLEDDNATVLNFDILGKKASIKMDEKGQISTSLTETQFKGLDYGPKSVCRGYSYECCDEISQKGVGQLLSEQITDCKDFCYPECIHIPVVLSFTPNPYYKPGTREIEVKSGDIVTFKYALTDKLLKSDDEFQILTSKDVGFFWQILANLRKLELSLKGMNIDGSDKINSRTTESIEVVIDFGDGKTEKISTLQGSANHAYTCNNNPCLYRAKINIKKGNLKNIDTDINQIKVVVN